MNTSYIKTYFVIVNYNGYDDTVSCINSLLSLDNNNFQIIIVDNLSSNNSINIIYNEFKNLSLIVHEDQLKPNYIYSNKIIIIASKSNRGFSAGNNIALKYILSFSSHSYICILNNDTEVKSDFLDQMILNYKEEYGIIAPTIYNYYDRTKIWSSGGKFNYLTGVYDNNHKALVSDITSTKFLTGCCLFLSSKALNNLGLMDESYFLYYEDADFCFKAIQNGFQLKIIRNGEIYHKISRSTINGSPKMIYYFHRGRLKFIYNNYKGLKKYFYLFINIIIRLIRLVQFALKFEFKLANNVYKAIWDFNK